MNTVFCEL